MDFRTEVKIPQSNMLIGHEDRIMTFGSCFSENISHKLTNAGFLINANPFGVLFNPYSVCQSVDRLLQFRQFDESELFKSGSLWNSFMHSSAFSDTTAELTLQKINNSCYQASEFLKNAQVLILTFGTAWVYENRKDGRIVANCHKLPSENFNRRRLSINEIVEDYSALIEKLTDNAETNLKKVIMTVSPVRHWKDGARENNISKGILQLAIEVLEKKFAVVEYFPAYEIVMDELRDYRFYAADMCHPTEQAIDYIWEKFSGSQFSAQTRQLISEVTHLRNQLNHRPLHPQTTEYLEFRREIEFRMEKLISKYPVLSNRL